MVFKTTSTKRRRAAFTLIEMMIALTLGMLISAALLYFLLSSAHGFAALDNYFATDLKSQTALDKMSQEIRQVQKLTSYSPSNLTFVDYDGTNLQYSYDAAGLTLTRTKNGTSEFLLTNCMSFNISLFQQTLLSNKFQPWSTTSATNARVIQLSLICSNSSSLRPADTESLKSGMIVIRHP